MKRGIAGYAGCCEYEVWGVSIDCPCLQPRFVEPGPIGTFAIATPYDLEGPLANSSGGTQQTEVTITPLLFPRQPNAAQWKLYAAQLPSSYPTGCSPQTTSQSSKHEGTWSTELCVLAEHKEDNDFNTIPYWRYCYQSRAIYTDWQQSHVVYRYSSYNAQAPPTNQYPAAEADMGEISIVSIGKQEVVERIDMQHCVSNLLGTSHVAEKTEMETQLEFIFLSMPETFNYHGLMWEYGNQPAAQGISYGRDYAIFSTYSPDLQEYNPWIVSRLKYRGTRLGTSPDLEVFVSHTVGLFPAYPLAREYMVVLPSCRVFIDSQAPQPDECWVCAISNSGTPKLVTGRWLDKVYRPGFGGEDESTGMADGTLAESAIENWIVNLQAGPHYTQPLAGEAWQDIRVRCYNHIDGQDLLVFTSSSNSQKTAIPLATFEDGETNKGLPEGVEFDAGTIERGWMPDNSDSHNGSWSLRSSATDLFGPIVNSISVNVTENGSDFSFWWVHDNRRDFRVNFPSVDDYFAFLIDGEEIIRITHADDPVHPDTYEVWQEFRLSTQFPDKLLTAGTHTFTWIHFRASTAIDNPHLATFIDDVQFPEILIDDDADAKKRWFYAGGRVRRAKYWAWAKQDEEDNTTVNGTRTSKTVPDFITMDREGRIYYGNPHYVCRIIIDDNGNDYIDETFGDVPHKLTKTKGYVRFTATTNIDPPTVECLDPEGTWLGDTADDPRWGSFQILPTHNGIQLRGVNGAMRDATVDPIDRNSYKFTHPVHEGAIAEEVFRDFLTSRGRWSQRPSCWTILDDGKTLIPHLEVLWRPTKDAPAWPDKIWPHPPYRSDFEHSHLGTGHDPFLMEWVQGQRGGCIRPRELFNLDLEDEHPRWSHVNWVIPRGYSDALTRSPQVVWWRKKDDPDNMDDGWDPDWAPWYAFGLGKRGGPWPSVDWRLVQARFDPVGWRWFAFFHQVDITEALFCEDEEVNTQIWRTTYEGGVNFWVYTDFDAIDTGGGACCHAASA